MSGTTAAHPEKLGKYVIDAVLGQGSMGIVYKAHDPLIERVVALKTIRKDLLDPDEQANALARFRREAQAAGRLNHPNIVTLYDYGEEGDTVYIAMEYVLGRELKSFFKERERFDKPAIINIMTQLLDALDYSHRQGVVHRDIKPGNIMVMDNGRIKITDFGIARIESSSMTQFGTIMGTPSYMSPEQYMGLPVDGRSDIFSAGVLLYQLATGEKPFHGDSMSTVMHMVLQVEPVNPAQLNLALSTAFGAEILKALAKKPEDRFQTAAEFSAAIVMAASQPAESESTNTPPPIINRQPVTTDSDATVLQGRSQPTAQKIAETPAPRNQGLIILLLGLVLLAAALYGGWRWLSSSPPAPKITEQSQPVSTPPPAQPELPKIGQPESRPTATPAQPPKPSSGRAAKPSKPTGSIFAPGAFTPPDPGLEPQPKPKARSTDPGGGGKIISDEEWRR